MPGHSGADLQPGAKRSACIEAGLGRPHLYLNMETRLGSVILSSEQVDAFAELGFLVIPAIAGADRVAAMRAAAMGDLLADRGPVEREAEVGYPGAPASTEAPGGRTVRRLLRAYDRHPLFRDWVHDPRLGGVLRRLLDSEPVLMSQAHHNCIMTKRPEWSSDTGWHRDVRYWRFSNPRLVNVWLALSDETAVRGALRIIPGSHHWQVPGADYDDQQFLRVDRPAWRQAAHEALQIELAPGDGLLFDAALFHSASRNQGRTQKFSAVFTFHGPDTQPLPGSRSASLPEVAL